MTAVAGRGDRHPGCRGNPGGLDVSRRSATRFVAPIDRHERTSLNRSRPRLRAIRFSRQVGQRFESLAVLERAAAIARELELPPEQFDADS